MKKAKFHKYLLLMVLLLRGMSLFAQKEANIWYFGDKAGLDFNTNPPTALTNSVLNTLEGSSSIADKNGNLLFYTDGITVWNKYHQIMTNGTGLLGDPSSTNSALVIKHPGVDSIYFIFTAGAFGSRNGVCYSIIDMKLSGTMGSVTTKNIKLVNVSAEKIAAISHANQRDIWVTIPAYGSDSIYTFLITPSGINLNALIYRTGTLISRADVGQIKFSNNASKLAFTLQNKNTTLVSNFNNLTGFISNTRTISGYDTPYGLEFSPNSQYLYINELFKGLSQCAIPNISTTNNIVCNIIDSPSSSNRNFGQLQLGPDSKIYSALLGNTYIGIIENPNNYYSTCGYIQNAKYLSGKIINLGLPTFYQNFFSPNSFITVNPVCLGDSSDISVNVDNYKIDSINWYIEDTITPIFHGSKIKQFKYLNKNTVTKIILAKVYSSSSVQNYYDSLIIKPNPIFHLPTDTSLCIGDSLKLKATYPGAKYLWQDNTSDSTYLVKKSGLYWVKADYNGCVKYDSVEISSRSKPFINLGNDTTLCENSTLLLKVPTNYQSYLWNDLSTADSLLVSKEGLYSVSVNDSGCIAEDEIKVSYLKTPNVNLGNDTSFCEGVPFYLKATNSQTNYLWSNFSTDSVIKITQSGTYWLKAYNTCGTSFDTTEIKVEACNCYIYVPSAFTPNGNGLNEVFLPVSNCKITNYQLIILNRWGVKIFESNNPNIGWNGKLNEILQSNDVYVYQIQADLIDNFIGTNKKQVSLKGNVTLLN